MRAFKAANHPTKPTKCRMADVCTRAWDAVLFRWFSFISIKLGRTHAFSHESGAFARDTPHFFNDIIIEIHLLLSISSRAAEQSSAHALPSFPCMRGTTKGAKESPNSSTQREWESKLCKVKYAREQVHALALKTLLREVSMDGWLTGALKGAQCVYQY